VIAPIQVQQLAEAGARFAAAAMAAAGAAFANQPRLLQRKPDKAVGQGHAALALGEAMKVAHVPAEVPLSIQPQDAGDLGCRRLARGWPCRRSYKASCPPASYRARQRRRLRGSIPRMSAACNQLSVPARARQMTS
jgi:hypothetical protein